MHVRAHRQTGMDTNTNRLKYSDMYTDRHAHRHRRSYTMKQAQRQYTDIGTQTDRHRQKRTQTGRYILTYTSNEIHRQRDTTDREYP